MIWFPQIIIILIYLLKKLLKGSTIFIYGPEASGKTTLVKFLTTGIIDEEYWPTTDREIHIPKDGKIKLSEFEFRIEEIITGPGSIYPDSDIVTKIISFKILKERNYDYLFYVFDVSRIFNNDNEYIQCIQADVELMKEYVTIKKILLIGTHLDILNLKDVEKNIKAIEKQISSIQVITKMIRELEKNNKIKGPIIGSLKNEVLAGELTLRILEAMRKLKEA